MLVSLVGTRMRDIVRSQVDTLLITSLMGLGACLEFLRSFWSSVSDYHAKERHITLKRAPRDR